MLTTLLCKQTLSASYLGLFVLFAFYCEKLPQLNTLLLLWWKKIFPPWEDDKLFYQKGFSCFPLKGIWAKKT